MNMRFVVIASLRRGAIEPATVLNDQDQALAMARWDRDDAGIGEVVLWRDGLPYVDLKQTGGQRQPRISALAGPRVALDDSWEPRRRRAAERG
jgi:hypothetical protein